MPGHAGRGVDLEQEGLVVGFAQHHIDPGPAFAVERQEGFERQRPDAGRQGLGQPGRTLVAGVVAKVLVLIIVIACRRDDLDDRHGPGTRAGSDDRHGQFAPVNELLAQHGIVVPAGNLEGSSALVLGYHLGKADGRPLTRWLDRQRQTEAARGIEHITGSAGQRKGGCLQRVGHPDPLGEDLVHRHRRGHHPRTGVGNAEQLERALHRAVFAVAAMQRDEGAGKIFFHQIADRTQRGVESMGIDAFGAQRGQHPGARHQRHFAFGRLTAHQHRHLAEVRHRSAP